MNKSTLVKFGALVASSFIGASAFAAMIEVVPEVAPVRIAPPVVTGAAPAPAPALNMSAFGTAYTAPKVQANANKVAPKTGKQCDVNFPKHAAQVAGLTERRVMELIQKNVVALEASCENGLEEAGDEVVKNVMITGDYTEKNGGLVATDDQLVHIMGAGLAGAMNIPQEIAEEKAKHVRKTCGWFMPEFGPEHYANIHEGNDTVN